MVSNVNLFKDCKYSDSGVLMYISVKDYSFVALPYVCTPIRLYVCMKALFHHKLAYYLILTPYHLFLHTNSIAYTWEYFHSNFKLVLITLLGRDCNKEYKQINQIYHTAPLSPHTYYFVQTMSLSTYQKG